MPPVRVGRAIGLVLVGSVVVGAFRRWRRWHLRWGATDEEVRRAMPGDDMVPVPTFGATRAITIGSPPEVVWPWLVQIGYGRAGFYSYDVLDNLGRGRSAEEVRPELQDLRIGDWIPMAPTVTEETAFRVAAIDPGRSMLWTKPASTWAWMLEPLDGGRTRLIARLRARYRWTRPTIITDLVLMELGDFFMMRKQLLEIRRRAEAVSG